MPRTKKTAVEPIAEAVFEKPATEAEAAVVTAEEPKKTTRKRTPKAAEEKTEAAPKKCCVRKKAAEETMAEETKEEPKKAPAKKAAPKKEAEQVNIKIQFGGKDFSTEEILEKAKAAFAAANEGVEIKTVDLYVNADDRAAYYVVNGQVPENNKIEL